MIHIPTRNQNPGGYWGVSHSVYGSRVLLQFGNEQAQIRLGFAPEQSEVLIRTLKDKSSALFVQQYGLDVQCEVGQIAGMTAMRLVEDEDAVTLVFYPDEVARLIDMLKKHKQTVETESRFENLVKRLEYKYYARKPSGTAQTGT